MWRTPKPVEVGDGPDDQGWITIRIQFDNLEEATFVTLGLGTHAIVVEPAALQERLVHDVQALTARLRTDGVLE